jgi:hypothetical protein
MMKLLPANVRQQVYYFAWVVKGRPQNVHPDFGRMSFFCSKELSAEQHCSSAEVFECVHRAANELLQNLDALVSQLSSVDPLPLDLSHHCIGAAQKLFTAACRVFENPSPPSRALLHGLDQDHFCVVFQYTWRHMGHVEGDRIGELEFLCESGSPSLKFYALVDSAMQFVHMAQHDCSRRPDGAHERGNQHVANPQDERVTNEGNNADYPPSSAAGQAASSAIPHSPEGDGRVVCNRSTAVAASASASASSAADATEGAVESSNSADSQIK